MTLGLNAKNRPQNNNSNFTRPDPIEPGTYPARLVMVGMVGTQPQNPYKGVDKPPADEILLTYELLDEFMKDEDGNDIEDKPRWITETMAFHSLTADLAKSTKRYYALDPNEEHEGDWTGLLGVPCMVTINNRPSKDGERVYENVSAVSTMRDKDASRAPELVNEAIAFDFDEPDEEVFAKLPKWILNKMKGAVNYKGSSAEEVVESVEEAREEAKTQEEGGGSQKTTKASKAPPKAAVKAQAKKTTKRREPSVDDIGENEESLKEAAKGRGEKVASRNRGPVEDEGW